MASKRPIKDDDEHQSHSEQHQHCEWFFYRLYNMETIILSSILW